MSLGLWFGWFTMQLQILHSFASSTAVYFMLALLPKNLGYKLAFVFTMLYISISHIYRMYTDYMGWTMDFTGPQMVLTIKLIMFAFDFHDGFIPEKVLSCKSVAF